jgi:hypothetical protein
MRTFAVMDVNSNHKQQKTTMMIALALTIAISHCSSLVINPALCYSDA